jgi:hypothetical protein
MCTTSFPMRGWLCRGHPRQVICALFPKPSPAVPRSGAQGSSASWMTARGPYTRRYRVYQPRRRHGSQHPDPHPGQRTEIPCAPVRASWRTRYRKGSERHVPRPRDYAARRWGKEEEKEERGCLLFYSPFSVLEPCLYVDQRRAHRERQDRATLWRQTNETVAVRRGRVLMEGMALKEAVIGWHVCTAG